MPKIKYYNGDHTDLLDDRRGPDDQVTSGINRTHLTNFRDVKGREKPLH